MIFKQFGVGLAAAILIDATLVRAILLPASMKLLDDWNWYLPTWLDWLPHLEHRGSVEPTPDRAGGTGRHARPSRARPTPERTTTMTGQLHADQTRTQVPGREAARGVILRRSILFGVPLLYLLLGLLHPTSNPELGDETRLFIVLHIAQLFLIGGLAYVLWLLGDLLEPELRGLILYWAPVCCGSRLPSLSSRRSGGWPLDPRWGC